MNTDHTTADQPDELRQQAKVIIKNVALVIKQDELAVTLSGVKSALQGVESLEDYVEALLRRHVLTAQIKEAEDAITEYNRLQEYMTEPSQDLKFGNDYLLDRLAALRDELAGLTGEK